MCIRSIYICTRARVYVYRSDIIWTYPSGWYFQRQYLDFRCGRSIPETGVGHCRIPPFLIPLLLFPRPFRCRLARYCWLTAATRVLTLRDVGWSMLKANLHATLWQMTALIGRKAQESKAIFSQWSLSLMWQTKPGISATTRTMVMIHPGHITNISPLSFFISVEKITLETSQLPILFAMLSRSYYNFKFIPAKLSFEKSSTEPMWRVVHCRTDCRRRV